MFLVEMGGWIEPIAGFLLLKFLRNGAGAVGMGCMKLGIPKPQDLRKKQAVAAAGQSQLMRMYEAGQALKLWPLGD